MVEDPERVEFAIGPIILRGHCWRSGGEGKRPALVEFNPYRCRDGTLYADSLIYPFFAERGYDCYRFDLPGSGDSTGTLDDEYTAQELSCCRQVIERIAADHLSSGRVCMMGKSWSAINALMLAAFDPPEALAAVIFCCGTDDRFEDDVHYRGGAMISDNFSWASSMFGWNFLPPDPDVTPDWQAQWIERVQKADFWFRIWAAEENQERSAYWAETAVRDHYAKVEVPVFLLSGWEDGYKNVIPRAMAGLVKSRDVRGLIGPWGHKYPFNGYPGPRIDWLNPVERWLAAWLKDADPAPPVIEGWPSFLVWLGDSIAPSQAPADQVPGRWVAEDEDWAERVRPWRLYSREEAIEIDTPRETGATAMMEASSWGAFGNADLPGDMGPDDEQCVIFDTLPFEQDFDVFGHPVFGFSCPTPSEPAALCVRLSEIDPESGAVHLVSYAFVNLSQGKRTIELNALGRRFRKGWRLRLALSNHWFPTLWPSGSGPVTLSRTWLDLPLRDPRPQDAEARPSTDVQTADADRRCPSTAIFPASVTRGVWRGVVESERVTEVRKSFDSGKTRYDGMLRGLIVDQSASETHRAYAGSERYALSATSVTDYARESWWARTETETAVDWAGGEELSYRASVTISDHTGLSLTKTLTGTLKRRWI